MPIKPENKNRYPKNWKQIVESIRERANDSCEWCHIPNHCYINGKTRELCLPDENHAIRIVCTTAHLNHLPEDCRPENLAFLCQRCHNRYDTPHRVHTRKQNKYKGMKSLF